MSKSDKNDNTIIAAILAYLILIFAINNGSTTNNIISPPYSLTI